MPLKINQSGIAPLIVVIAIAVAAALVGTGVYLTSKQKVSAPQTTSSPTSSPSPITSPTPTPSPTPTAKPTLKPTLPPTPKPTATSSPQPAGIHADPASITMTKKKTELGENIAQITLYYPGVHSVNIGPDDGTVGIFAVFKDNNTTFIEVHDQATLRLGFVSAWGRDIKVGVNKVNLEVKEGPNLLDALNSSDVKLSIPVQITTIDQ